jgi:DNA modification methylase
LVLDPFMGSGTTALVSESLGRKWLGYEMSESYIEIAKSRIDESIRLTRYMNAND